MSARTTTLIRQAAAYRAVRLAALLPIPLILAIIETAGGKFP